MVECVVFIRDFLGVRSFFFCSVEYREYGDEVSLEVGFGVFCVVFVFYFGKMVLGEGFEFWY